MKLHSSDPIVVFHGTRTSVRFNEFRIGSYGNEEENDYTSGSGPDVTALLGAHFAFDFKKAKQFAQAEFPWMRTRFDGQENFPRVIVAEINCPIFDIGTEEELRDLIYLNSIDDEYILECLLKRDGIEPETPEAEEWFQQYDHDSKFRQEKNSSYFEACNVGDDDNRNDAAAQLAYDARVKLLVQGIKAIRYKNEVEGGDAVVVLDSDCIRILTEIVDLDIESVNIHDILMMNDPAQIKFEFMEEEAA